MWKSSAERQCESHCFYVQKLKKAFAIGHLERFAADYEHESGNISIRKPLQQTKLKLPL